MVAPWGVRGAIRSPVARGAGGQDLWLTGGRREAEDQGIDGGGGSVSGGAKAEFALLADFGLSRRSPGPGTANGNGTILLRDERSVLPVHGFLRML